MNFELFIHHGFDLMRIAGAKGQQTQVVAKEFDRVVIVLERREIAEQRALGRILDVVLECQITFRLVASLKTENRTPNNSVYWSFLYFGPLSRVPMAFPEPTKTGFRLAMMNAPMPAPRMMTNSIGCHRIPRSP